jgi:hypothetical protein
MRIRDDEPCPCESGKPFGECHGDLRSRAKNSRVLKPVQLTVIPEPDPGTRPVFINNGDTTVLFTGSHGGYSLNCGHCNSPLVTGLDRNEIRGVVLHCNKCGSFNDT